MSDAVMMLARITGIWATFTFIIFSLAIYTQLQHERRLTQSADQLITANWKNSYEFYQDIFLLQNQYRRGYITIRLYKIESSYILKIFKQLNNKWKILPHCFCLHSACNAKKEQYIGEYTSRQRVCTAMYDINLQIEQDIHSAAVSKFVRRSGFMISHAILAQTYS